VRLLVLRVRRARQHQSQRTDDQTRDERHAGMQVRNGRNSRQSHLGNRYFFVKIDLGIMQCTPLRISTTWETRQSPTIDVSE
jgi:hypothetical protein